MPLSILSLKTENTKMLFNEDKNSVLILVSDNWEWDQLANGTQYFVIFNCKFKFSCYCKNLDFPLTNCPVNFSTYLKKWSIVFFIFVNCVQFSIFFIRCILDCSFIKISILINWWKNRIDYTYENVYLLVLVRLGTNSDLLLINCQ